MKNVISKLTLGMIGLTCLGDGSDIFADTTTVEYDVDSSYTLVIPQKVELQSNNTTNMSIKTINRNLEPGVTMAVSISEGLDKDGEIKLERKGSTSDVLTSTVKVEGEAVTLANPTVGEFSGYETDETEVSSIEFGVPQGDKLAGSYSQTLVFSVSAK